MRVAEPAISHDEVIEIIDALTDMKAGLARSCLSLKTRRKMSRRRDWHPPWMTPEEWAEWKAGENDRSRRLYERAKRGHEELEARKRAAEEAEQGRARRRRFFLFR